MTEDGLMIKKWRPHGYNSTKPQDTATYAMAMERAKAMAERARELQWRHLVKIMDEGWS